MRINSIYARNFRTLEDFELAFDGNYCTLSGQNNAGKTAIVSIIQHFFESGEDAVFAQDEKDIVFPKDKTQWSEAEDFEISVKVDIDEKDDSEVFYFLRKFSPQELAGGKASVRLSQYFSKEQTPLSCRVDGSDVDSQAASEIAKKFKAATNLVLHNSTRPSRKYLFFPVGYTELLDSHLTPNDKSSIAQAQKTLQHRVKKAAKNHKEALGELLGKLSDNFQVDLTTMGTSSSSSIPLNVTLTDKNVDLPLVDWGSGTQNRTRVLMSILDAARTKGSATPENKSTPVVIVEEPESFLHPSAQAEFGKVLNELADEFGVQIIATTHSPYMLNQSNPSSNVLLERKEFRGKLKQTVRTESSGHEWMQPFARNLGIVPEEFEAWESVFVSKKSRVVLVEGEIDKEYFEHIKKTYPKLYQLPDDVEVVSYGGKDALKNTPLLKFMTGKFEKVFVTFDLDCKCEVEKPLKSIGLEETTDYCAIGVQESGLECIEGLLPESLLSEVYSSEPRKVAALGSTDGKAKKSAKSHLKTKMLEKFKSGTWTDNELKAFKSLFTTLKKQF